MDKALFEGLNEAQAYKLRIVFAEKAVELLGVPCQNLKVVSSAAETGSVLPQLFAEDPFYYMAPGGMLPWAVQGGQQYIKRESARRSASQIITRLTTNRQFQTNTQNHYAWIAALCLTKVAAALAMSKVIYPNMNAVGTAAREDMQSWILNALSRAK